MAPRIPTYTGPQERVLQVDQLDQASMRETQNMIGSIQNAVSRMAKFSFEQESREAERRGQQRVADQGAQSVLKDIRASGGPRNIEERAAVEAGNRIASAELETEALLEMNDLLARAEKQEIPLAQFQDQLSDVTDGFPAALSSLNPVLAGQLQAKLQGKAAVIGQSYADFAHKKQVKDAQGRALIGIDTRQKSILSSASMANVFRDEIISEELRELQTYMEDLQFPADFVSKVMLETREKSVVEGIRFDFGNLQNPKQQAEFLEKLSKKPPKELGQTGTAALVSSLKTSMNAGMKVYKGQVKSVNERIKDLEEILEAGGQLPTGVLNDLESQLQSLGSITDVATGQAIATDAAKNLQELKVTDAMLTGMKQMTPEQADAQVAQLSKGMSDVGGEGIDTVIEAKAIKTARKMAKTIRTNVTADAMDHAATVGLIPSEPILFSGTPEDVLNSIQKRRANYQTVQAAFPNQSVMPLTKAEYQILNDRLETATKNEKMFVFATIVSGFGKDAPRVFEGLGKESALHAHVGGLMLLGQESSARKILNGIELQQEGGPFPLEDITNNDLQTLFLEAIGSSFFAQDTSVRGAVYEAAQAIFISNMNESGGLKRRAAQDQEFLKAINMATGGDGNLDESGKGGVREVRDRPTYVPPNMTADDLENILTNLTSEMFEDMSGAKINKARLEEINESDDIFLQTAGEGLYYLMKGSNRDSSYQKMLGIDGAPYVINIRAAQGLP